MLDVNTLISKEEFYYSNCIYTRSLGLLHYSLTQDGLTPYEGGQFNEDDLTDIFANFTYELRGSIYVGGEASAHSSCGFIYKTTNKCLDWILVNLDSGPFVKITHDNSSVKFISDTGSICTIRNEQSLEISNIFTLDIKSF